MLLESNSQKDSVSVQLAIVSKILDDFLLATYS